MAEMVMEKAKGPLDRRLSMVVDVEEMVPTMGTLQVNEEEDSEGEATSSSSSSIDEDDYIQEKYVKPPVPGVPRVRRQTEMRLTSMSAKWTVFCQCNSQGE